MSGTTLIALYAAVVSTAAFLWNVFSFISENRRKSKERTRIAVQLGSITIVPNVPKIGEMRFVPLHIMNLGREDAIIVNVEMRMSNGGTYFPGAYNEPEAMLGIHSERLLPKRLAPGETLVLRQFSPENFRETPDIVVIDSDGKEYRIDKTELSMSVQSIQRDLLKSN